MSKIYDLAVIGAGTGGYPAAIRAAQLGLKVVCFDKWLNNNKPALGGTCLNVGCIPSKALLETSRKYHEIEQNITEHGISTGKLQIDLKKSLKRKDQIIYDLTNGIAQLFQAHKVECLQGTATITKLNGETKTIDFVPHAHQKDAEKKQEIICKNILIASGSVVKELPIAPFDKKLICDSEETLKWDKCPKTLGIIGAGAIGLELGSIWARYGAKVTIFDSLDELLPNAERLTAKSVQKEFTDQGMEFQLGVQIQKIEPKNSKVEIEYILKKEKYKKTFEKIIVAIGRKPYTDNLLSNGQELEIENGFIKVDELCQTSIPGVFAAGDVVRGPMLAHKSAEEGIMVAELIAGNYHSLNYQAIPMVIYTHPEIAWVGLTSSEAEQLGHKIKTGKFAFAVNGRAKAALETDGQVVVVSDAENDRILGIHIFGSGASEIIAQAVIALEFEATTEDIQRIMFAHPTMSESFHEACLGVDGLAIHAISKGPKTNRK